MKCPMCNDSGSIKVDDYALMRWRLASCPVCLDKRRQALRFTYGRSLLLDLLEANAILAKEV